MMGKRTACNRFAFAYHNRFINEQGEYIKVVKPKAEVKQNANHSNTGKRSWPVQMRRFPNISADARGSSRRG